MKLTFLGTGAGAPSKVRNVASVTLDLIPENGSVWMFDAGEGTQLQLMKTTTSLARLNRIFITHLHGDHVFGLPGVLSSRSLQAQASPMHIYGPAGISDFVEATLRLSNTHLTYDLSVQEVEDGETIFHDSRFTVSVRALDHVVPSLGYRIEEDERPGALQVDRLRALRLSPGSLYGLLKAGHTVALPDGRVINGEDFLGPGRPGRVVAITGDTRPNQATVDLAQGADVLVHESTYGPSGAIMAGRFGHSTCTQAANMAARACVRTLLLTHFSARHTSEDLDELQTEARAVFPNTFVMRDLDEMDIPFAPRDEA